ncbi:MAG TPA: hypothetical protein DEA08_29640, partial [Planctomycetes bacterium]|nr:hypothetical protein [Planctomycetota bacterium]
MKRRAAVLALLFIGLAGGALAQESKQIDEALVALRDGDARARSDAIDLLGHVQTAASRAEVTSALRAATHDEDPNLRALAISSLVRVDGSGALDDCLRLLVDPDRSVRIFAVNALWQTFPYPTPVPASCAPGIAAALDRCDGDLRRDLFNLLTCVRPLRASLPLLLERWRETASCPFPAVGEGHLELAQALRREALPERRQVLCEWLTQVLHELGPRGAAALPELVPLLEHDDPRQRRLAAEWLGGMGPAAAPGLVGLVALLEDEDADVREEA